MSAALKIDQIWGGTRVVYNAVESSTAIYIGYYDTDRWLTVSEVNKCTGEIKKVRLPSQFAGWDAHKYVALSLDADERLHVAGNMHVSPLIYARMSRAGDLQSLSILQPQVGKSEDRTTYPAFFTFPDGALGFSYRNGQSGNGEEIINRFDGKKWRRWLDTPLFAPAKGGQHVNAYHTDYLKGPDNNFHVAWVWRQNYKIETNFNVNYARSPDLKSWFNSRGELLTLPLTPLNADLAAQVPPGNGLFNNIRIGLGAKSQPIISYLKFDSAGATQLWHARSVDGVWEKYQSTHWNYRWDARGGGTIPGLISFEGVVWRDGLLLEHVRHPVAGDVTLQYNLNSLQTDKLFQKFAWSSLPKIDRVKVKGAIIISGPVRKADGKTVEGRAISWLSMPPDTRDKERDCHPEIADCRYAFDLILHNANQLVK